MKKIYVVILLSFFASGMQEKMNAQCAAQVTLGTSSNMFTLIRNGNHPIVVDKTMNMVAFVHRNNAALLGGNSGELRYDISTNSGATWTVNQGILNPNLTNFARYPNAAIYNPTANTTPNNAYISYLAPTIDISTSAWNGVVSGVRQFSGGGSTETYNQNGIGTNQIPHSMVKGAPGVFWAIDPINTIATGFNIYRGVWSTSLNDVVWNVNYSVTPSFMSSWTSAPQVVDYNIAFDPSGQIGYFSFLGHVVGTATNNAIYPILYKTTNGGTTWTGPIQVNLSGFSCITGSVTSGAFASCNTEHDLIVDALGNPHIISTLGSATNYIFNYSASHRMYDITLKNSMWVAHDLGNVNGSPFTAGISPNIAVHWQAPQAARSADGSKVFFTWTDNATYTLGQSNASPDLFGKAFDVNTGMWTQTKNFTACNSNLAGKILYPHLATEVLEPNASTWKMAAVYGEPSISNDLIAVANFHFLDNLTFSSSEFTVAVPPATVTIAQGPTLIYCPNTTVNITVPNAGDVLWSNSATVNPLPITTGSIATYSVIAQVGCRIGTTSINVVNLSVNAGALTPSICPGTSASFTASGNALNYAWLPGTATGTNVSLFPTANTVTLIANGSSGCSVQNTVGIFIFPQPTVTISGGGTVCAGYTYTQTAGGAQNYLWSDGSTGNTYTAVASSNTVVGLIGISANSCTNATFINIVVSPTPVVNASSSQPSVCLGQSVTLFGSGSAQTTFSWNGNVSGANIVVSPTQSTTYTLTGQNTFSCQTSRTLEITVESLPVLTVTASRPSVCRNEKVTLTASGASTYTWLPQGAITSSLLLTPTLAQTYSYTLLMVAANGCTNTGSYQLVVSACTGISESVPAMSFAVYPNPNAGNFTIQSTRDENLKLISQTGQLIMNLDLNAGNEYKAQISGLVPGIYFIAGTESHLKIVIGQN